MAKSRQKKMKAQQLWSEYLQLHSKLIRIRMAMHGHRDNLVEFVSSSLMRSGDECAAALDYISFLSMDHAVLLIPALIRVAITSHGQTSRARETLAGLPREDVLRHVKQAEIEVLEQRDYEEFSGILHLWRCLGDEEKATALARQASDDPDENIKFTANEFLNRS
jgi:hypothetical protein